MQVIRKVKGVCAFLSVTALASSAAAQASMPAKHVQLVTIQVKSGADAQFADYLKKIVEAANKVCERGDAKPELVVLRRLCVS